MVDGLGCFVPRGPVLDYHGTARDITYVSPRRLPNQQWSSWTFRIPSLSPISTRYLPRSLFGSRLVPRLLSAKALIHRNQDNTSPLLLRCFIDKCRRAFLGQATISTEITVFQILGDLGRLSSQIPDAVKSFFILSGFTDLIVIIELDANIREISYGFGFFFSRFSTIFSVLNSADYGHMMPYHPDQSIPVSFRIAKSQNRRRVSIQGTEGGVPVGLASRSTTLPRWLASDSSPKV